MSDNPVLAAMEAYKRTHPHREDEVDAAFERFDPESLDEVPVAVVAPALPPPDPEQIPMPTEMDRPEWA